MNIETNFQISFCLSLKVGRQIFIILLASED